MVGEYSDASTRHVFDASDKASSTLDYGSAVRRIPKVDSKRASIEKKEGQRKSVQIQNLDKVLLKPNSITDKDKLALAEFIKVTHTDGQ